MCDHKYEYTEYKSHLIYASNFGHIDCVNALIAAGANVDHQNNNGNTALMMTAHTDNIKCINALITARSSINVKNNDDQPAILWATCIGNIKCIKLFLENGAELYNDAINMYAHKQQITIEQAFTELNSFARPWRQKQLNGFIQGVSESINCNTLLLKINYDNSPLRIIMDFL